MNKYIAVAIFAMSFFSHVIEARKPSKPSSHAPVDQSAKPGLSDPHTRTQVELLKVMWQSFCNEYCTSWGFSRS